MNQRELFRHIIDGCDEALRDAFIRRMEASTQMAQYKLDTKQGIYDPVREDEIVKSISSGLPPELELKAQSLWRSLIRMSRGRQYHYFIQNDSSLVLKHESDILPSPPAAPVYCSDTDSRLVSSLLGADAQPVPSGGIALDSLESGTCTYAAIVLDDFYDSDWLFSRIFDRHIYVNSITVAPSGKHVFLMSRNLYDMPENKMISLAFAVSTTMHGSLAQTLEIFSDLKINLEYLRFKTHNIDADSKNQQYIVFADFVGKLSSSAVRTALLQMESESPFFRVMGYRRRID